MPDTPLTAEQYIELRSAIIAGGGEAALEVLQGIQSPKARIDLKEKNEELLIIARDAAVHIGELRRLLGDAEADRNQLRAQLAEAHKPGAYGHAWDKGLPTLPRS